MGDGCDSDDLNSRASQRFGGSFPWQVVVAVKPFDPLCIRVKGDCSYGKAAAGKPVVKGFEPGYLIQALLIVRAPEKENGQVCLIFGRCVFGGAVGRPE